MEPGRHLLVMGRSGSGKTTLLRAMGGFEALSSGKVELGGERVLDPANRLIPGHPGAHYFPQDFGLSLHKTVEANIREVVPHLSETAVRRRVASVLQMVGLPRMGKRTLETLSGGQRQRVGWARALAPEPNYLLMDEPFSNLDRLTRLELLELLPGWLEHSGTTLVLVAHEPEVARMLGYPILILEEGRVVQVGSRESLLQNPALPLVTALVQDA